MQGKKPIRILLADDHRMVRRGFRLILESEPDIVVMDVRMPERNGIEATRRLHETAPRIRVLSVSVHRNGVYVREAVRAGAEDYIFNKSGDVELLSAVRSVAEGNSCFSPEIARAVLKDYRRHATNPIDLLTAREREILQMVAEGKTNKDIAALLNLSVHTVDGHRTRIMDKLGLHSVGKVIRFAIRHGVVE